MKNNYFISVFIAVALCFGQLASNAHVLNHLSAPVDHAEVGHIHQNLSVLHTDAQAADEHGNEKLECAIYHTFAGSNCLMTVQICDSVAQYECVAAAAILSLLLPSGISDNLHIRGPPQIS